MLQADLLVPTAGWTGERLPSTNGSQKPLGQEVLKPRVTCVGLPDCRVWGRKLNKTKQEKGYTEENFLD